MAHGHAVINLEAYKLGLAAGHRTPPYSKHETPHDPYPSGSTDSKDWQEGFGDATEDYIHYQGLDD